MFNKKKKEDPFLEINYSLVIMNNMVDICTDACAVCWDKPAPKEYEKKLNYIKSRVNIGHESVIEHSNFVILIEAAVLHMESVMDVLQYCKYLNTKVEVKDNMIYLLIGGSIRGWKHIYKTSYNLNNPIISIITKAIYDNCPKEFFNDLIKDGILKENRFGERVINDKVSHPVDNLCTDDNDYSEKINIINFDYIVPNGAIDTILRVFRDRRNILSDFLTVTILFKNMSRTGTHQLVRHRNAITQESQRYVDYSEAMFASPDEFKDDYDGKLFTCSILGAGEFTLKEIGEMLQPVYTELLGQGLKKEDARAYLLNNVKCKKLFMTFTLTNLMQFLRLRCDIHAQAEIRTFAIAIEEIISYEIDDIDKLIEEVNIPVYKMIEKYDTDDYKDIDEPVGDPFVVKTEDPDKEVDIPESGLL